MTAFTNNPSYHGYIHLGSGYLGGYAPVYNRPDYPLTDGYNIIFYDRAGQKVAEISSQIQNTVLLDCFFELLPTGCGTFQMKLRGLTNALEDLTYNYRIDIHPFNDINPWYSGYIIEKPLAGDTSNIYTIKGYGYFNQLKDIMIEDDFTSDRVDDIVKSLMTSDVEDKTDIIYKEIRIEEADYVVQSISWQHVTAKEVMKQLSELMLGYEFGVNEFRQFFFRPKVTTIQDEAQLFVGKHVKKFIPKENIDKVRNRLHIYGGEVTGTPPSNYVATVEDTDSQDTYGLREAKLTIPSVLDATDAEQWGDFKLAELKDAEQSARIDGVDINIKKKKIDARGNARITSDDGLNEYTLPIKSVRYTINADGVTARVQLGKKDKLFTELQLELQQEIITQEQLGDQRVSQS